MTPVHTEKRRRSIWDMLLLAVAVFMIWQGFVTGDALPVLTGLGVGAFLFLTRHTRYELFQDALVIRFMAPRRIVVPLAEVQDIRLVRLPLGGPALLVQRTRGGGLAIMPADPEGFLARLQAGTGAKTQPPEPETADAPKTAPRRRRPPRRRV